MIQFITVEYARLNGRSDLLILGRWRFPSIFCNQAVRLNRKPISRASSAKTSVNTDTVCFSQNHSSLRNNSGECLVFGEFEDNSTGTICKCALDHKRGMFHLKQQGFGFWK